MDGGAMPHAAGAQIGGRSMELEHSGWTEPFTHRHTQSAIAGPENDSAKARAINRFKSASPKVARGS